MQEQPEQVEQIKSSFGKKNTKIIIFCFLLIIFFLLSLILLIVFSSEFQILFKLKSPNELFKELTIKEEPDGLYEYELVTGVSDVGPGSVFNNIVANKKIFKLGEETKILISSSLFGMTINKASFFKKGKIITCTEGPGLDFGASKEVHCSLGSDISEFPDYFDIDFSTITEFNPNLYDEFNINYDKKKEFADRKCYNFVINLTGQGLEKFIGDFRKDFPGFLINLSKDDSGEVVYNVCLDKKYGFISDLKVDFLKYSPLTKQKNQVFSTTMTLKNFLKDKVTPMDLELPINFSVDKVVCSKGKISAEITAFNKLDSENIKMTVDDNQPFFTVVNIPEFEKSKVEFYVDEKFKYNSNLEFCINDECQKQNCEEFYYNYNRNCKNYDLAPDFSLGDWRIDENAESLFDDFSDGDYFKNPAWLARDENESVRGNWQVEAGWLKQLDPSGYPTLTSVSTFKPPYLLEGDLKIVSGNAMIGMCAGGISGSPQVFLGNIVYFGAFANDRTLNSYNYCWDNNTIYNIKILVTNDSAKFYINNKFIAEVKHNTTDLPLCPVRVETSFGEAYFDNIKFSPLIRK